MFPSLDINGRIISPYSIATIVAILSAGFIGMRMSKKRGIRDVDMLILMLVAAIGVILGGHLLFGIVTMINNREVLPEIFARVDSFETFGRVFFTIFGGSVFYGGLLGGIAAGMIYIKRKKLDAGAYADVMALVAPLFHSIGRIGCFLGGCCFGVEWEYGFTYHHSLAEAANGVPRFPVQLLEAAWIFAVFVLVYALFKRERFKNRLFCIYLTAYAPGRFFIEFLRGDEVRGLYGGLSTSQIISVLVLAGAIAIFVKKPLDNAKDI